MLVFLLSTKKLSLRVLPAILMVLLIGLGFIFIS
jgi:hypothetical protein